jgi:hypothetical protein
LLKFENVVSRLFLIGDAGSSCLLVDVSASSFSGVGQIPSCSYKSKKLELVGGALNDILVERDRGRMTAPELDLGRMTAPELDLGRMTAPEFERDRMEDSDPEERGIVCVGAGPIPGLEEGVGGSGDVGGGVSDDTDVEADTGREVMGK